MNIRWTKRAKTAANEVGVYILTTFGEKTFDKYGDKLLHVAGLLADSPNIGRIEPLLEHRPKLYRSLVVTKRSKLIYHIDGETIYIVDVWDTRREPKKLVKGL